VETIQQLSLPLFAPPSFSDLLNINGMSGLLEVTVNPRLKRGWQVKVRPFSKKRQLTIPRHLCDAPREVKEALIAWALLPCRPGRSRKQEVRRQRSILEKTVWCHIESIPNTPRRTSRFSAKAFAEKTKGERYDLREVFETVNAVYFNHALAAVVRWGDKKSKTSYHTLKTDSTGTKVNCITIAGVYNHKDVPRFAIEAIMHHEMLHIAVPPYRKNSRLVIHGKEFRTAERNFPFHEAWRQWEKNDLTRILRKLRQRF